MMTTVNNLPHDLQEALNSMHNASELSGALLAEYETTTYWPDEALVQKILHHIGRPDWELDAEHQVKGVYENAVVDVQFRVVFKLQVGSLGKQVRHREVSQLPDEVEEKLHEKQQELDELIQQTLIPRSFGVSTKIEIASWQHDLDAPVLTENMSKAIAKLTLVEGIIHVDYATLVTALLRSPRSEPSAFGKSYTLPLALFEEKKPFEKSFHWHDASLIYGVQCKFAPI